MEEKQKASIGNAVPAEKYAAISAAYSTWVEEQFTSTLMFDDKEKFMPMFRPKHSSLVRSNSLRFSKQFIMDPMNTLVTSFRLKSLDTDKMVSYGFLYSEYSPTNLLNVRAPNSAQDIVDPSWLSMSPSFISCDGEYRRRVNNFHPIKAASTMYTEIWQHIERVLIRKINDNNWILVEETFYPTDLSQKAAAALAYNIRSQRLPIQLLQMAWFVSVFEVHLGEDENHINPMYKEIILKDIKKDIKVVREMITLFGADMHLLYNLLTWINGNINKIPKTYTIEYGQKIIPMGLADVQNPFNMKHPVWKEFMILRRLSVLVVNNIACGVPIFIGWMYIKNSHKDLFDNPIQYERLKLGETAAYITKQLVDAKSAIRAGLLDHDGSKSMMSGKFESMYKMLKEPIEFAKSELIMSNVAMCLFSEYVGKTFMNEAVICSKSRLHHKELGNPFTDLTMFKRYMFEVCYNLYCLNRYMGLIHCDLHLNNVTFRKRFASASVENVVLPKPHVLFVLSEAKVKFLIPSTYHNSSIIDFSRCAIHRDHIDSYQLTDVDERFPPISRPEAEVDSRNRLMSAFINLFPEMAEKNDILAALFVSHYDSMFHLMTLIDVINFCTKARRMFLTKRFIKVVAEYPKFLTQLINEATQLILSGVNRLISDYRYVPPQYPGVAVMKQVFAEFLVDDEPPDVDLIDIYVANPLKEQPYAFNDAKEFPPHLRESVASAPPALKEIFKVMDKKKRSEERHYNKKMKAAMDVIELISRRHGEKTQIDKSPPLMLRT